MRLFSLAFLLGILLLQNFSYLPSKNEIGVPIIIIAFIALWVRYLRIFAFCALGFAWMLWYAQSSLSWSLRDDWQGKTLKIQGYIASLPETSLQGNVFLFAPKSIQFENEKQTVKGLFRLNWHNSSSLPLRLRVGDEWQFSARLKKIHGVMNPGGFDFDAFALQQGIRATGYIVNSDDNKLLDSQFFHFTLDRMRQALKDKIEKNLPLTNTSPWITALTIGERHGINAENWEILRKTGTNHLMAIAGLHIGFMSGFVSNLISWMWRRIPILVLKIPTQHAGAIAALLMAILYSAMAGFSIPTQRACIMLIAFIIVLLLRRRVLAWHAWSCALLIVLLLNPLSVLTESFWLSFGAVALIIYGMSGRLAPKGLWWKWGRIQWVIAFGLIPFSLWLFQQCSIVSFIANSIAIPWVGFLVVPLSLLGCLIVLFSAKLGGLILILADKSLSLLWIVLTKLSHLSWSSWYQFIPSHWMLVTACLGVIFLLLPAGFPGRYLGFIWILPLFYYKPVTPKAGEVWLTLLDVGQGLSTVVQTQNHFLIFDTGPKLSINYDMGESVVVPFLRSQGAKQIDMLVVSHGDNDHIGGAQAIFNHFPVIATKSSVPDKLHMTQASLCLRNQSWEWDNVNFRFLYPTLEKLGLNNDSSCVLRITSGDKHILLTGDIEKIAERNLVEDELQSLPADVLIAPHHGSKTSAENTFLKNVHPFYVLFPIGYRNRYHFPHVSVIKKYDELGVMQLDTAHGGAIQLKINNHSISQPSLYRITHHHYWN